MSLSDPKFLVYKSSAGSGKTYTLVREYLKIVIRDPEQYRRILAITFTNKAANEMKERVVRYLVALADPVNHSGSDTIRFLLPQLAESLKLSEAEVSSRAGLVLKLIIHHYGDFAISTIDSFTHRVIRTFAFDLKIPLNFEVELDTQSILSQAVDSLISLVGSDEKLTRLLIDFTEKKAGDEQSWHIEKDLNDYSKTLLSEDSIDYAAIVNQLDMDIFFRVRNQLVAWRSAFEKELRESAAGLVAMARKLGISVDDIHNKSKGVLTYLERVAGGDTGNIAPNSYARHSLETGEWLGSKASPGARQAFMSAEDQLVPKGKDLIGFIDSKANDYQLAGLLLKNIFSTALLGEIEKTISDICKENNKLLISEFNRRISGIVSRQPAPFIYERLGEKYHHYLIDEFQDTSVLQWHNLLPLLENSLASSRVNLVVGDAKQAIYRWRSGDAEQFEQLPELNRHPDDMIMFDRENVLKMHYREEHLDSNHRSSPVIVDFNNRLFTTICPALPEGHNRSYRSVEQIPVKKDKPGMVRIEVIDGEGDNDLYREMTLAKVLDTINELLDDRFEMKDVAILCRDNKKASNIAGFLVTNGVPVISGESLLLTQSDRVNFLVAWLNHVASPGTEIHIAHILQFLLTGGYLDTDDVEGVFSKEGHSLKAFEEKLSRRFPGFSSSALGGMELFGLVRFLVLYFGLDRDNDSYIRFFQDAILRFMSTRKGGVQEFLDWWEDESSRASVVIPEGINAVRVMTIHKAKGLQFPAVIYPYADEEVRPTRKNIWVTVDKEYARPLNVAYLPVQKSLENTEYAPLYQLETSRSTIDMVNLLYVALTRPEERLYVFTKKLPAKTDRLSSVPKVFSYFLREEGLLAEDQAVFAFGERWKRPGRVEEDKTIRPPSTQEFQMRKSLKLLLRRHAPKAWDVHEPERNREWGNLVHLAMAGIMENSQVEGVLEDLLHQGLIDHLQRNELTKLIEAMMAHPDLSGLYQPGFEVRNEPEIMDKDGSLYRPDRVLLNGQKAVIIDYKTGKPRDDHHKQVEDYASLLREMNYEPESAFLVYLDKHPEVVRVI